MNSREGLRHVPHPEIHQCLILLIKWDFESSLELIRVLSFWCDTHTFITWLPAVVLKRRVCVCKAWTHGRMMEKEDRTPDFHRLTSGKQTPVFMSYHHHWSADVLYDTESFLHDDLDLTSSSCGVFVCRDTSQLFALTKPAKLLFKYKNLEYSVFINAFGSVFGFLTCLRASRLFTML